MNAVTHGFTANHAITPEEAVVMEARFQSWVPSLAPDHDPLKTDLLRQAVRNYHKIDRIHDCDDAESLRRVRNSDANWRREQAQKLVETLGKLETQPLVAAYELEATVEGCDWKLNTLEGIHVALEAAIWLPENQRLLRKLLKYESGDPKGALRAPDVWYDKINRYIQFAKHNSTPIAQLPWEQRVITCEKLTLASRYDVELMDRLEAEAKPLCGKLENLILGEVARTKEIREKLLPFEALDRDQARFRALVDDSPASKQRARYLKDAERAMHACFKQVGDVWKLQKQMGIVFEPPAEEPEPATQLIETAETCAEAAPSRNEPNSEPENRPEHPTHEQSSKPIAPNLTVAPETKRRPNRE
jgi:hypothetical protein